MRVKNAESIKELHMGETVVKLINNYLNVDCLNTRFERFLLRISSYNLKVFQIGCQHIVNFAEIWPRIMQILTDSINCSLQTRLYEGKVNTFLLEDTRKTAKMREDIRK